jgi:protein involved in polysaccharide export with SLBB domain
MYKLFLIVVFLALFGSYSDHAAGQVTTTTQPLTNIKDPKNPTSPVPTVAPGPTDQNAVAKELYKEGMKLAEVGQFSQAAENFQQALRLDPEYADAYAALGRAYFKMREWQKASDNLRRAAELNKRQRESHTNAAGVNTLRLESETKQPEQRKEISTPAKAGPASSQTKRPQETNANAVGVKTLSPNAETTRQPEQPKETSTPAKSIATSPETKPPQETNAKAAGVKTLSPNSETKRQPEQPKETSTPAKSIATSPETKPPQETNPNVAGAKTLSPESETTAQPDQRKTSSTPAKATPNGPETKLTQETNANVAEVKTFGPELETTGQPEPEVGGVPTAKGGDGNALELKGEPVSVRVAMSVTPASTPAETKSASPISIEPTSGEDSLTKIYRVGPSDVLDIRLNGSQSPQSTLFTVTPSGLLEYPMLTEPLIVTGLTVEEIGTKIGNDLKQRALIDDPRVVVGVRDYASHTILVSGLVKDSGTKVLRREAVPLYVVVADAQPLPQAAKVTIVRNALNRIYDIDLTQVAEMNLLVRPGDVITLHPNVTQFFYIGGEVKFPGEKTYRRGLTLMQAIIAAGGVTPKTKVAEIDRDDGRGYLVGTQFNLKDIQSGKAADPLLKPGDRIMILR